MHHFFVAPELLTSTTGAISEAPQVALPKELAHQLRDVLHLQVGEQIVLLDNSGDEILATIASISKAGVDVHPVERHAGKSEPRARIILCQGLLKSARFEWVLEKGTELGVSVFSPILCRRSMAGLEDAGTAKLQRWRRIIQEAAEQSGRARLPELLPIRPLANALNDIPPGALALMPWEEEHAFTLRDALRDKIRLMASIGDEGDRKGPPSTQAHPRPYNDYEDDLPMPVHSKGEGGVDEGWGSLRSPSDQIQITVVIFIGPEGGLQADEVKLAQRYGARVVSLGPRILRAETAALAAVVSVVYELER